MKEFHVKISGRTFSVKAMTRGTAISTVYNAVNKILSPKKIKKTDLACELKK